MTRPSTTPRKPLRVAMVGVGGFGARRRSMMRDTGLFDLVAAYDLSDEALEQARSEDGAEPVDSFEALLDVPGIEAVFIATGAKFHTEQLVAAARRGLHVFVEKPLCSTPDEVKQVLDVWHETGVVIGCGHTDHTTKPMSQLIKTRIDHGELGTVAAFEKTTCHAGGQTLKPGDWREDPDKNPGGMLFQCGVHGIHELMYYFGPVAEVQAMTRHDVLTSRTDDVALCHLRFHSGVIGTLNAYHTSPYRHTFSLFGTRANLYRFDHFFHEGTELFQQTQASHGEHQPRRRVELPSNGSAACGGLESFYHAIHRGGTPYPSVIDGARAVEVVFAAMESAREKRSVLIQDTMPDLPATATHAR